VSLVAGATRPSTLCVSDWTCEDIGTGFPTGGQVFNGSTWTVNTAGNDIWDGYDRFHFIHQDMPIDGSVSTRVVSQTNVDQWAKAGPMLRVSNAPEAAYYAALLTPAHGIAVQFRAHTGDTLTTQQVLMPAVQPQWLRVARWTDPNSNISYYSTYTSVDGNSWSLIPGSTVVLELQPDLMAGVAADSHAAEKGTTVFQDTAVSLVSTPPPDACPSGWTCEDVGTGFPAGSQSLQAGTWTLNAGGPDIWDTVDEFRMVSQPLTGDGTVAARVTGQANAGEWAKAGVMLRASNDASAPYYGALVTPAHGIVVQWRTSQGATTNQVQLPGTTPAWLMVGRYTANAITYYTAYTSADGATWTAVPGSTQVLTLPPTLRAGLAANSWNGGLAQVTFDNVALGGAAPAPPGLCPNTWTCADIGGATPAGTQDLSGGTWTIRGGGGDIWNQGDQFHYAYLGLPGDGTISGRVVSQGSTNTWAKAGLMIRGGTDTLAPYYAVLVTPANGVIVQWRDAQGNPSSQVKIAGAAPKFLRISRTGTAFSAAVSDDGQTWFPVAGADVNLPSLSGAVLEGMAVTSHDTGQLSTVVFDSISLT
jgi:hypothetical protein